MDDKLAFLDGTPEPEAEAVETAEVIEAVEPAAEPETVETPPAPTAEPEKTVQQVPLMAVLDERDKRQSAERERDELRRVIAEYQAAQQPKKDFFDDPDGALRTVAQQTEAAVTATKLQLSRFFAEKELGADKVAEAYRFFDENPHLSADLLKSPSPFHEAVAVYERHKLMSEIGSDPSAWRAKQEATLREQIREEERAKLLAETPPKPRIPGSLASAPASGSRSEPTARGSAFDAAFPL